MVITLTISDKLVDQVDAVRKSEARASYIRRAIEEKLQVLMPSRAFIVFDARPRRRQPGGEKRHHRPVLFTTARKRPSSRTPC